MNHVFLKMSEASSSLLLRKKELKSWGKIELLTNFVTFISYFFPLKIAPIHLRGAFGVLHQLCVVTGILISQVGLNT